ncbi:histidine kinase dimerization/phosphoacceptor domain -containing protein [Dethiosulfovibrio salsuginis]|uniref:histidine kinase dimerization/phosphoacceptor domain -containing protein n=1 Tax=Dethiosulfovibrio salsuginis TaxID=561720 RepID=UPI0013564A99|nr:histidine kinase dimerization/phosphoacceptor domain -containing protein [Dethiosulfovibrio salsuginis]
MKDISKCLVMIVDDSVDDLDRLVDLLSPMCEVAVALDGRSSLKVAEKVLPDLFIINVKMSEVSGFDLCRIVKSSDGMGHVPVMFVSDQSDLRSRQKGLSLGAVDYVCKPYDALELKLRVESHLRLKVARESLETKNDMLEQEVLKRTEDLRYAMERLETSEKEFRSLAEGLPDVVFRVGSDERFRYVSGALRSFMGREPSDLIGKTMEESGFSDLFPSVDLESMKTILRSGEKVYFESPVRINDQFKGVAEIRVVPEREGGLVVSALGIVRDISLQRSVEERYSRLFSMMKDGLVVIELDPYDRFKILDCNAAFSSMMSSPKRLIGSPLSDLLPITSQLWTGAIGKVVASGGAVTVEGHCGEMGLMLETVVYLAGPDTCVCIVRDVTEQREAQERLASQGEFLGSLVENMPVGIFAKDMSAGGIYVIWNSRMADITGVDCDQALGATESDVFDKLVSEKLLEDGNLTFKKGYPLMFEYDRSFTGRTARGQCHLKVIRVPIFGEDGSPSVLLGMVEDVTGLIVANERLEESLKDKDMLIQEVHHRVKNNLQVMASLISLQASRASDPSLVDVLQDSRSRIMAMAYVHELLYRNTHFSSLKIADYLGELSGALASTYGTGRNIRISLDVDDTGLSVDKAVPCGLIVNELVTNSLKHGFIGRDSGNISISVRTVEGTVLMEVSDDGVGTLTKIGEGAGLGMTIVNGLIRQLGASMTVDDGDGLSFRIEFPAEVEQG